MKRLLLSIIFIALAACQTHSQDTFKSTLQSHFQAALLSPDRSDTHMARDRYRHPAETLSFFGIQPDMTVVEIWPGPAGWYTEILAPYLRDNGKLYAAHFPPDTGIDFYSRSLEKFENKLTANKALYDRVSITYLYPPKHTNISPAGNADAVLTFRNVHNWAKAGKTNAVFQSFFNALKPGGILGVVEHRANSGTSIKEQISSGYMTEDYVIEAAQKAGFELIGRSDTNANPKDTHDHPAGVWTLPPSLRLGEDAKTFYLGIGESDRMTLKFRKPGP